MDGWLGALVSLSIVLAAAPTVAATSPVEQVEDTPADDEDPRVDRETSLLADIVEPRLYLETSLANGTSEASLELQMAETDHAVALMVTSDEEDPRREPIHVEVEFSETEDTSNSCVNIYLPQTPPVYVDPDCVPEIDDLVQPQ